jgi:serine phosphatase RsbU (regulator of sigma subunit)
MLLADVSGHGEMVSQTAIALRDLLRQNVNYINQTRFVQAMNRQFTELSEQGGFATAVASTFFSPTQSLSVCNAGHPPPLVFRDATSEWSELKQEQCQSSTLADIPLGISEDVSYRQFDTQLRTGDMMLSYSDAVPESLNRDGRQLGQEGMLRLVRQLGCTDPNELIPEVIQRISELADGNLEQDDATLFLCCATGGGPSLRDNLLAPFRFFGSVTDRTELS